jgi:hypothetical protein
MSARLSPKTEQHIAALFPQHLRSEAAELLVHHCDNNLPFCEKSDEFELERVRFAALKLSRGEIVRLREAIKLAQEDWRDLLVAVGFGNLGAHKEWSPEHKQSTD